MDEKDRKILDLLQWDAKLSTSQIGKQLSIPTTTVFNRIKALEKEGIIKGYTAKLDYAKLGLPITGHILVTVSYTLHDGERVSQEVVAREIKRLGCESVSIVTGETDIIVKVRVADVEQLNDFVVRKLRAIKGVDKTRTMIVLSEV